ncbi:MAG: GNAT family N-acetyltransferase [Planctomycetota bacterium]|jgi:GNAT superfamily N-acetyltransferase
MDSCRELAWDSDHFGFKVASCSATEDVRTEELAAWCKARTIKCLYVFVRPEDTGVVARLHRWGARLADVRLTLEKPVAEPPPDGPKGDLSVRAASIDDIEPLARMSEDVRFATRFRMDPGFPDEDVDRLYSAWVENSIRDFADAVFVACQGETRLGFVTCHLDSDTTGSIGLFAVAERAQGRGCGGALLKAVERFAHTSGRRLLSVRTQAWNVAALRVYESAGMLPRSAVMIYHKWFGGET